MTKPIMSLKFVHDAITKELQDLEERAAAATSGQDIAALADALEFFCEVMHFHHKGEEEGVFPVLEEDEPGVSATYLREHEQETQALTALRAQVAAAHRGEPVVAADFHEALKEVSTAGLTHIEKENTQVLPMLAEKLSPQEQGAVVAKVVGAIPKEKMPLLVPWIVARLSDEGATRYVQGLEAAMPAAVFLAAQSWIKGGVSETRWIALRQNVPVLGA